MEYSKVINCLEYTTNQPSKLARKSWVEVNDYSPGTYKVNNQIKFKTLMLWSGLCDYSDPYYILVSANITASNTAAAKAAAKNIKKIIIKNCAPFTYYISEIKKYTNR